MKPARSIIRSVAALALAGSLVIVPSSAMAGPIMDVFMDSISSVLAKHIRKSEQHFASCSNWCEKNPPCIKCSRKPGCGKGYKKLKGWTGFGKNWYACAPAKNRAAASRINKDACLNWCRLHENCVKCSRKIGCGRGYKKLKSWTGYGKNWYACKKR